MISPAWATASNSISLAFSRNRETTTGNSLDTLAAMPKKCSISSLVWQTRIAAPDNTYDGRINTGKPTRSTNSFTSSIEESSFHSGWSMPRLSSIEENLWRFSARSIETAGVPKIGTFWRCSFIARLFGIWPPTEIITPFGCSKSMTSSTRSSESSSK